MILIADGGSTKADWIAINDEKKEEFRVRTLGLNPAVIPEEELHNRIINMFQLMSVKDDVQEIHFYGAGCGTPKPIKILRIKNERFRMYCFVWVGVCWLVLALRWLFCVAWLWLCPLQCAT